MKIQNLTENVCLLRNTAKLLKVISLKRKPLKCTLKLKTTKKLLFLRYLIASIFVMFCYIFVRDCTTETCQKSVTSRILFPNNS